MSEYEGGVENQVDDVEEEEIVVEAPELPAKPQLPAKIDDFTKAFALNGGSLNDFQKQMGAALNKSTTEPKIDPTPEEFMASIQDTAASAAAAAPETEEVSEPAAPSKPRQSTSVRVLTAFIPDIKLTYGKAAEAAGVTPPTVSRVVKDAAKMYFSLIISGKELSELANHYDNELTVEQLETLIPLFESQKRNLISEIKQQEAYMNGSYESPAPQQRPKPKDPYADYNPVTSPAPEIDSREKALWVVLNGMQIPQNQKMSVMELFKLTMSDGTANPQQMLVVLQNMLGPQRGHAVWTNYMLLVGQHLPDDQMNQYSGNPFASAGGSFPNQYSTQNYGQQQPANPMAKMVEEMRMQQMMQQMQDDKMDRQMKQMTNAVMMSVMAKALDQKGGQAPQQGQFGAYGGIPMKATVRKDSQGNVVEEIYTPVAAQHDESGNKAMETMLTMVMGQNQAFMTKVLSGNNDGTVKPLEFMKEAMSLVRGNNPQTDPVDFITKLRTGLPEVFGSKQTSLDEIKLNLDAKMQFLDKQMEIQKLQWEREEKVLEKTQAHENMKTYIDSIKEVGKDIIKPVAQTIADGYANRSKGAPAAAPQQQAQQATSQDQGQAPNFKSLSDDQLSKMDSERTQVMQEMQRRMSELGKRSNDLDMELQRRRATKTSQNAAVSAMSDTGTPYGISIGGDETSQQ